MKLDTLDVLSAVMLGVPPPSLLDASERWDRAWDALKRRDYAAFDEIMALDRMKDGQ
jgi:hypothetical protein